MKKYFKNIDRRSNIKPSEKAWLKLEQKLDKHRYSRGIHIYRNIAIAAIGLLLISITIMFSLGLEKDKQISHGDLVESFVYQIEDLASSTHEYYSADNIKILSEKYVLAGLLDK